MKPQDHLHVELSLPTSFPLSLWHKESRQNLREIDHHHDFLLEKLTRDSYHGFLVELSPA